jgi:hypothetical protein
MTLLYLMQPFSQAGMQHGENIFPKEILELEYKFLEEIYISGIELPRWSLELVLSFSKIYIWNLGVRLG